MDVIIIAKSSSVELGKARLQFCLGGMWQCEDGKCIKPRQGSRALAVLLQAGHPEVTAQKQTEMNF